MDHAYVKIKIKIPQSSESFQVHEHMETLLAPSHTPCPVHLFHLYPLSDPFIYLFLYTFSLQLFFSIMVYHRTLNIPLCAIQ